MDDPATTLVELWKKGPIILQKHSIDLEYRRYMDEVRAVLVSDKGMRDKLDTLDNNELAHGDIAEELNTLNPLLRTKLDEIKRAEVNRLLDEHRKYVKATGKDLDDILHVNLDNLKTFEAEDLRYLMKATVNDLNELDKIRRRIFKEHEMAKKLEEEEKLKTMNEDEKSKYLIEKENMAKIHREREQKTLHPGSEQQFQDVWENMDHMKEQPFNPTTFFLLHDLNGDQVWDENEVKSLFLREIRRLFKEDDPAYDPLEKEEESELMREHYFEEADINNDRLISMDEYSKHFENKEFLKKKWAPRGDRSLFTEEEYEFYSKSHKLGKTKTES